MLASNKHTLVRWSLGAALLATLAPAAVLGAQGNVAAVRGDVELTRAAVQTERTNIVSGYLNMTDAQSKKFWPLYREYRTATQKANDASVQFITSLADRSTPLSENDSKMALDGFLLRQQQIAKLNTTYAKKFLNVLPATQVARLFQLENKMNAVVAYELAGSVPLVGGNDPAKKPANPHE